MDNILDNLSKFYEFSNKDDVIKFVSQDEDLFYILISAPKYIYEIFGTDIKLILELFTDIEEGWDELFIIIKSSYPFETTDEFEKKLFDEWFINIMDKVGNKLNFITEPL